MKKNSKQNRTYIREKALQTNATLVANLQHTKHVIMSIAAKSPLLLTNCSPDTQRVKEKIDFVKPLQSFHCP